MSSNSTTPLGPPPPDPSLPHDTKQLDIIISSTVTWACALVFVWARCYTKTKVNRKSLSASEWFLLLSLICSLGTSACQIVEAELGMGRHMWDLDPMNSNVMGAIEAGWVSFIFYSAALAFAKVSILLLFISVFVYTWVQVACWVVLAVIFLSNVWVYYVIFTACVPLQVYWDNTVPGVCNPQSYWLANQIFFIVTDFLIFFLPIPLVLRLRWRWQQKVMLLGLFASGLFVCLISIIRLVVLNPTFVNAGPDISYNITPAYHWTCVEVNLAIVVASAITLKPLINHAFPGLFPRSQATSRGSGPSLGADNAITTVGSGRTDGSQRNIIESGTASEVKQGDDLDLELGDSPRNYSRQFTPPQDSKMSSEKTLT